MSWANVVGGFGRNRAVGAIVRSKRKLQALIGTPGKESIVGHPMATTSHAGPSITTGTPHVQTTGDRRPIMTLSSWLDRPLSGGKCFLGWVAATVVFLGWVRLFGGPAYIDASESVYSTWAIAHGHLACAYPPGSPYRFPGINQPISFIAPLWPLISSGITAVAQIGHQVPFPSAAAMGPHCSTALTAMTHWSTRSGAMPTTMKVGYLCWFVTV
jgi:hypothetical protein